MSSSSSVCAPADCAEPVSARLPVRFSIHAAAEPGVMPRVLELFAKRGLVPQEWHSRVAGPALMIDLKLDDLCPEVTDFMARCMRQIVGVEVVLTSAAAGSF